jgi:hypothetical protein
MPPGLSNLVAIAVGDNHFLTLNLDGAVNAWGSDDDGETNVPPTLPPVALVAAGFSHSSALVGTGPPHLIAAPVSCAGGVGTALGLRVSATGAWPLRYQWRFNGLDLPNATNSVLWLSDLQRQLAGAYSVVVSNSYGALLSPDALVDVQGVSIAIQPVPQVAYRGGTVSFVVQAAGQEPISYQWRFNDAEIPGATNAILTLTNLQSEQAGVYVASVGNPFGSVTSSEAQLTILPVLIKAQPISRQALEGGAVSFEVAVDGIPPFTYQWQFNGADLPGMTNASLSLGNVQPGQAGAYSVIVTSPFGSITSSPAMFYVLEIAAWGGNSHGQIEIPIGLTNVIAIAGGGDYTLALKGDRTVAAWGDIRYGQTNAPKGLVDVSAIARGSYHNLALRSDGTVVSWGDNTYGQTNAPANLTDAIAISAGAYHNLALRAGGSVVAWGGNQQGQIDVPVELSNVVAIAGIANYSLALRANGTVAAWGDDTFGQTEVPLDLTNVIAIAGEATHALALKLDGTVVSWGSSGQGGTNVPPDLTNVVAISGGEAHDVALQADGTVVGWGDNTEGQVIVPEGLTNVVAIAAGRKHTVALVGNGSPKITVQPWDQQLPDGANVILAAKAVGAQPLQYQWQFNGVDIPGATLQNYSITNAQIQRAGDYVLVVSNQVGAVSSRKNKLVVLSAPMSPSFVPGSIARQSDGSLRFTVMSALDCRLAFEASRDLVHWIPLATLTNISGTVSFTDPDNGFSSCFYRVRLAP